jgi:hypothetical protein
MARPHTRRRVGNNGDAGVEAPPLNRKPFSPDKRRWGDLADGWANRRKITTTQENLVMRRSEKQIASSSSGTQGHCPW